MPLVGGAEDQGGLVAMPPVVAERVLQAAFDGRQFPRTSTPGALLLHSARYLSLGRSGSSE